MGDSMTVLIPNTAHPDPDLHLPSDTCTGMASAEAIRGRPRSANSVRPCSAGSRRGLRVKTGGGSNASTFDSEGTARLPRACSLVDEARRQRIRERGPQQPHVPRAMRPSSACSHERSRPGTIAVGAVGSTPWQPSIGGGSHNSYTSISGTQLQPQLEDCRLVNKSVLQQEPEATLESLETTRRRLTFCPYMRAKGICRSPNCPYIHEACRPRKEHTPLGASNP